MTISPDAAKSLPECSNEVVGRTAPQGVRQDHHTDDVESTFSWTQALQCSPRLNCRFILAHFHLFLNIFQDTDWVTMGSTAVPNTSSSIICGVLFDLYKGASSCP